jgi:hypothetical protein
VVVSQSAAPNGSYTIALPYSGFVPSRVTLLQCAWTGQQTPNFGDACSSRIVLAPPAGIHATGVDINPAGITVNPAAGLVSIEIYAGWWAWGFWTAATTIYECDGFDCNRAMYRLKLWR